MSARFCLTALSAIIVGFTTGALAGCQQGGTHAALTPAAGYGLHFVDEGDSAKLAYGPANAEAVGLMMECAKGSSRVELSDLQRNGGRNLTLVSDNRRSDFVAAVDQSGESPVLLATAHANDPALEGFRKTGRIEVNSGRRYALTATSAERALVGRFLAACRA